MSTHVDGEKSSTFDDSDEESSRSASEASSEEDLSESEDGSNPVETGGPKSERTVRNQPFDEAMELSDSEGSILSEDPQSPSNQTGGGDKTLKNQPFDEALELSESTHEVESPKKTLAAPRDTKKSAFVGNEMKNNPFDEQVEISDSDESIDTNGEPSPKAKASIKETRLAAVHSETKVTEPASKPIKAEPEAVQKAASSSSDESESEEEEEEEGEGEETSHVATTKAEETNTGKSSSYETMLANAGGYNESEYSHLKVSSEVRDLFQYIGRFQAHEIELESRLKCFIPEYIPAVGDMDAFLKVPRPDGQADQLGLKMLDEPSLSQSDATVLDLQLRATSKKKHGEMIVRSLENAEKSPKEIDRWIKSIADLHRTKPPPQVHYTKPMPDVEKLMQVWPEEFEELLNKSKLPSADLDMSLEQYVRVICALLDIPVYKNVYESLHVLFTLYLEFSRNQHFMPLL